MGMSKNHIYVKVTMEDGIVWKMRRHTWELLWHLARDANLSWCLLGDFNNVTSQQDKRGGHAYPTCLIDGFNDYLRDTGLQDLELIGHQFTWD